MILRFTLVVATLLCISMAWLAFGYTVTLHAPDDPILHSDQGWIG